jgi:hypothetical protein
MGEGEIVEIRAMEQQWEIVGRVDRVAHLLAWSQLCHQQPFGSKVAYGVGDRVKGYRAGRFTPLMNQPRQDAVRSVEPRSGYWLGDRAGLQLGKTDLGSRLQNTLMPFHVNTGQFLLSFFEILRKNNLLEG